MTAPREPAPGVLPRCALIISLALLAGVVTPALARGEWYDHYEDAIQALDGGDHQTAIESLDAALKRKKRSGYFRTYGNNYLRYVPHFYLGVAYHDAGDCERALTSFERSDAVKETEPEPALAARLRSLRSACEARLAPPPVVAKQSVTPPSSTGEGAPAATVASTKVDTAPSGAEDTATRPPPPTRTLAKPVLNADPEALESGLQAYLGGDFDRAIRVFTDLTRESPRSPRLRLLLGMSLHTSWFVGGQSDHNLLEGSRRELREASRLDPGLVPDPAICPPRVVALYRSLR